MQTDFTLLSIQTGKVTEFPPAGPGGKPWRSGILKLPRSGAVLVTRGGVEGDQQSDPKHHGGPERAVNVYPAEHYEYWHTFSSLADMGGGAFGENFTTLGMLEHTACVGDTIQVGDEVVAQITQPRGPCYKLNRRWNEPRLQKLAEETHRYGWYLRVLQEGQVEAGAPMRLLERPNPEWTIRRVWEIMQKDDPTELRVLIEVPHLSTKLREGLLGRLGD